MEISVYCSEIAGLRIASARLLLSQKPAVRYEIATPKGKKPEDIGKPGVFTFFGVDTGLACFADTQTSREYQVFFEQGEFDNM